MSGRIMWGMLLIVVGLLMLLETMDIMDFGSTVRQFWPVILILWGVMLMLRRGRTRRRSPVQETPPMTVSTAGERTPPIADKVTATDADQVFSSGVFGDQKLVVRSHAFRGGSVSVVFGDIHIDLSACAVADGSHTLKLSGVFGDVKVRLPRDVPVRVSANTLFGDVSVNEQKRTGVSPSLLHEEPLYSQASRRLWIDAAQVFGDVEVMGGS